VKKKEKTVSNLTRKKKARNRSRNLTMVWRHGEKAAKDYRKKGMCFGNGGNRSCHRCLKQRRIRRQFTCIRDLEAEKEWEGGTEDPSALHPKRWESRYCEKRTSKIRGPKAKGLRGKESDKLVGGS